MIYRHRKSIIDGCEIANIPKLYALLKDLTKEIQNVVDTTIDIIMEVELYYAEDD